MSNLGPKKEGLNIKGNGIILLLLASMAMMVMFIEIMLVPALPGIAMEYPQDAEWVSWIMSAYLLVGAVATPLLGRLGDMYGKKKVMILSMIAYVAGLMGCAFSWSIPSLIMFRAIQGIGMGIFPLAFGIVRDTFPRRMVPMAIGIISAMFSVGVSIGLLGGGWVVSNYDWRTAFDIVWPLMAFMTVVVYLTIKESSVRVSVKLDYAGTLLLAGGVFTLLFGLTQGEEWGWGSWLFIGSLVLSLLLLTSFVALERRIPNPIVSMRLMSCRGIAGANFAALFIGLSMFMMFQTLPFFLMAPDIAGGLGLKDTFTVGVYMFPSAIAQLIVAPLVGKFSKEIGADRILMAGLALVSAGYAMLIFFHGSELEIMASMFVSGSGFGCAMVSLISVVAMASPREEFGIASGMNTLFRVVGGSIGPVFASVIMASYTIDVGPMTLTGEDGYIWTWVAGIIFSFLGFLVVMTMRPGRGLDFENECAGPVD
ncbi:MAG: MFS transporter [Methanomassiliicoccales archaeon]|nr:MAG: MFS transporter [Methanomassiliicoccales archaeon]